MLAHEYKTVVQKSNSAKTFIMLVNNKTKPYRRANQQC